jgi:hypothetical protein
VGEATRISRARKCSLNPGCDIINLTISNSVVRSGSAFSRPGFVRYVARPE